MSANTYDSMEDVQLELVTVDLLIEGANSLKAKRAALNKIKDRVKSRFNASIAETSNLDKWQRAGLAIAMVSNERKKLQQDADRLESLLLSMTEISVNQFERNWL